MNGINITIYDGGDVGSLVDKMLAAHAAEVREDMMDSFEERIEELKEEFEELEQSLKEWKEKFNELSEEMEKANG